MSHEFNPYREWLGIDDAASAPDHYRLLGIQPFEIDLFVIKNAANSRRYTVQSHQDGPHADEARRLLRELDQAEICLFDRDRRAQYDAELNARINATSQAGSAPSPAPAPAMRPDQFLPPGATPGAVPAGPAPAMSPADFLPPSAATPVAQPIQSSATPPTASPPPAAIPTAQPVLPQAPAQRAPSQTPVAQPPAAMAPNQFATAQPAPPASGTSAQIPTASSAPSIPMASYAQAAAIPVASSVAHPTAIPAATPASFQQPAAEPSRTNIVGDRRSARRRKHSSLLVTAGAPAAGVVATGLLFLYLAQMGPFASSDTNQAMSQSDPAANRVTPTVPISTTKPPAEPLAPRQPPAMASVDPAPKNEPLALPPVNPPTPAPSAQPEPPAPTPPPGEPPKPEPPKPEPRKPEPPKPEPPKPEPPKPEPVRPDPRQLLQVAQALDSARYYLAQRDVASAQNQVDLAKKSDPSGALSAEIARVDMLRDLVRQFWEAVGVSVKSLQAGEEVTLPGKNGPVTFVVVEIEPDGLTIKIAGRVNTYHYKTMKSGMAYAFAERWLKKNDAASLMVLGAFKAVNPTSERQEARDLWDEAARLGLRDVAMSLMPELEIPISKELPAPIEAIGQPKPTRDGRFPAPTDAALKQATALADVQYRSRMDGAKSASDKADLAEEIKSHAVSEQTDANLRYVLLTRAADLFAGGGKYELAIGVIDTLEQSHVVKGIEMKASLIDTSSRSAPADPQTNQKLSAAGLLVADEALLLGEYTEALLAIRAARAAAVKTRDKELVSEANGRMEEVIDARKAAGGG